MRSFLKNGTTILLTTDGTWQWTGWDGRLTVSSYAKLLHLVDGNIVLESDVPQLTLLFPREYTALAFSDTPGLIAPNGLFAADQPTLADKIKVSGSSPLLLTTTGAFTCFYTMPAMHITPGGPIPDPVPAKSGTWKVIDPNQQIFYRSEGPSLDVPCVDANINHMAHSEKIKAAMKTSDIWGALRAEINIEQFAVGMAIGGAVLGLAALTGVGAIVEGAAAGLLLAGAAASGYDIGEGIRHLSDFYQQTKTAQTCQDLANAGQTLSAAAAKGGMGTLGLAMSLLGAKKMSPKAPARAIENVDEFMASQTKRLNSKLGEKIGKGQIPQLKPGAEGTKAAIATVKQTLSKPTATTGVIPRAAVQGDYDLIHVYSEETGHTVSLRVLDNGQYEFDTLIPEKSSKFNR